MTSTIRMAIAAAVLFGASTVALAGSPEGPYAISPPAWSSLATGMTTTAPPSEVRGHPYALTGQPAQTPESTGWQWVSQNYGGKVIQVIPVR